MSRVFLIVRRKRNGIITVDYREDTRWCIYVHIVPKAISGYDWDKYYVGITSRKPEDRWGLNGCGYKYNEHFTRAINKYGWTNIEHEVVAFNLTKDEACKMEVSLIKELNSFNPQYGYNKTLGGEGVLGAPHHEWTDEERKQRSEMYKGDKNPYYGKTHSEEIREKMSKNHYNCKGGNNPRAKAIYQFDQDWNYINCYPSSRDAGRCLGCSDGMGSAAIHKKLYLGYVWVFEDNIIIDEFGNIQVKEKFEFQNKKRTYKKVYQFDENRNYIASYNSPVFVQKELGFKKSRIINAVNNKYKSYGYIWRYEEDVIESDENPDSFILLR